MIWVPHPKCAVCKWPVAVFYRKVEGDKIRFVAECHGQKEETLISGDDLPDGVALVAGVAFQKANGVTSC